jgi:hypothetical protein
MLAGPELFQIFPMARDRVNHKGFINCRNILIMNIMVDILRARKRSKLDFLAWLVLLVKKVEAEDAFPDFIYHLRTSRKETLRTWDVPYLLQP